MAKGRDIVCKVCHKTGENAKDGMCFTCYRSQQRLREKDPEAKKELDAARYSALQAKARDKMSKAAYDLSKILRIMKEFGEVSGYVKGDDFLLRTMEVEVPLLHVRTAKGEPQPDPLEGLDPNKDDATHLQQGEMGIGKTGKPYVVPPFAGDKSQPETQPEPAQAPEPTPIVAKKKPVHRVAAKKSSAKKRRAK